MKKAKSKAQKSDPNTTGYERRIALFDARPASDWNPNSYIFPRSRNKIQTTKYTLYNFLFKNLAMQFSRIANVFFAVLMAIQLIPEFALVNQFLTVLPLAFILVVTAVKDAFEDIKRHVEDGKVNTSIAHVISTSSPSRPITVPSDPEPKAANPVMKKLLGINRRFSLIDKLPKNVHLQDQNEKPETPWQARFWKDIQIGDIVCLQANEQIPADMVILTTSEPESMCYVETKNLDGETNLKIKKGLSEIQGIGGPQEGHVWQKLKGWVFTEPESSSLESFKGFLELPALNQLFPKMGAKLFRENNLASTSMAELVSGISLASTVALQPGESRQSLLHPTPAIDPNFIMSKKYPIDAKNLLLRGCTLRNTKHAVGLVIYTGQETKIMKNAGHTPTKVTVIEQKMNPHVVLNMLFLFIISLITAICSSIWESSKSASILSSAGSTSSRLWTGIATFLNATIIFQNIIPISLYVTVEFVKTFHAYFISQDLALYDEENDFQCKASSWTLSDDLGQIEYIFSDKTGTLTKNKMKFKRCSIDGTSYGHGMLGESPQEIAKTRALMTSKINKMFSNKFSNPEKLEFIDPDLIDNITNPGKTELYTQFFRLLAICHTVIIEENPSQETSDVPTADSQKKGPIREISYRAQSPDEEALVTSAKDLGFVFCGQVDKTVILDILGKRETYEMLQVLDFNSDRKRMSVIVRSEATSQITLFCKGADNIIYSRLAQGQDENKTKTLENLNRFAIEGLRTLCLAYRIIPEKEYSTWSAKYESALSANDRDKLLPELSSEIESNMTLLGCTAIEDELQDQVPECIETLMKAGIKIWVLTGDKVETAKTIGISCNLINKSMTNLTLEADASNVKSKIIDLLKKCFNIETEDLNQLSSEETYNNAFNSWLNDKSKLDYHSTLKEDEISVKKLFNKLKFTVLYIGYWLFGKGNVDQHFIEQSQPKVKKDIALLVDGPTLSFALQPDVENLTFHLFSRCKSVMCCRVTPLQKAQVVALVKRKKNIVALAVGDGANDVHMIQTADVGVGIRGQEGAQAVMASDYAIGQFKFLSRLILIHGHHDYVRISDLVLNFFVKNFVWTFVIVIYQAYCGYSANTLYDATYLTLFNMTLTLLPVFAMGIFEKDISDKWLKRYPALYKSGINRRRYTNKRFWFFTLDSIIQAFICFYIPLFSTALTSNEYFGRSTESFELATTMAISPLLVANSYIGLNMYHWSWPVFVAVIGSNLLCVAFVIINGLIPGSTSYPVAQELWYQPKTIFVVLVTVIASLLVRYVGIFVKSYLDPADTDIIREEAAEYKQQQRAKGVKEPSSQPPSPKEVRLKPAGPEPRSRSPFRFFFSSTEEPQQYFGSAFSQDEEAGAMIRYSLGKNTKTSRKSKKI